MADNHNMKKAIAIIMKARTLGIIWRLILQIILDRPSAIVNAWAKMNKRPDRCPAKIIIHPGNNSKTRHYLNIGIDGSVALVSFTDKEEHKKTIDNIFHCNECQRFVSSVGTDGRCGRCNPTLAG